VAEVGAETEVGPGAEVEGHVAQVARVTEAAPAGDALGAVVQTKGSVPRVGLVPVVWAVELISATTDIERSASQASVDVLPSVLMAASSAFDPVDAFKASAVAAPATHTGADDALEGPTVEVDANRLESTGPVVSAGPAATQEVKPPPAPSEPAMEK